MSLPSQKKVRPGGHSSKRYQEMKEEIDRLREALDLPSRTIEDWLELPEQMRDRMAGEAFFHEKGMKGSALRRLGFHVLPKGDKALEAQVFDTPGCKAIVEQDLEDAEVNRKPILAKLVFVARYGEDDPAIRAAQLVARMAGWQLTPESVTNIDQRRVTLLQIIGNAPSEQTAIETPPEEVQEAFLSHEPGEPVRVSSDDQIDALLESAT